MLVFVLFLKLDLKTANGLKNPYHHSVLIAFHIFSHFKIDSKACHIQLHHSAAESVDIVYFFTLNTLLTLIYSSVLLVQGVP